MGKIEYIIITKTYEMQILKNTRFHNSKIEYTAMYVPVRRTVVNLRVMEFFI